MNEHTGHHGHRTWRRRADQSARQVSFAIRHKWRKQHIDERLARRGYPICAPALYCRPARVAPAAVSTRWARTRPAIFTGHTTWASTAAIVAFAAIFPHNLASCALCPIPASPSLPALSRFDWGTDECCAAPTVGCMIRRGPIRRSRRAIQRAAHHQPAPVAVCLWVVALCRKLNMIGGYESGSGASTGLDGHHAAPR